MFYEMFILDEFLNKKMVKENYLENIEFKLL